MSPKKYFAQKNFVKKIPKVSDLQFPQSYLISLNLKDPEINLPSEQV